MNNLSFEQVKLHERALHLAKSHRHIEAELIRILQKIDQSKLFKKLNCPSLFIYATQILGLSEALAYAFISVARKSLEVPVLAEAIGEKALSVSKAVRITKALDLSNAQELVEFAKTHTSKEIDFEVAKNNPAVTLKSQVKVISKDQVQLCLNISKSFYEKLQRAQALRAQKQKSTKLEDVMEALIDDYLFHHDPVKKAERAIKKVKPCSSKVLKTSGSSNQSDPSNQSSDQFHSDSFNPSNPVNEHYPSNQSIQIALSNQSISTSEFNQQDPSNPTSSLNPSNPSAPFNQLNSFNQPSPSNNLNPSNQPLPSNQPNSSKLSHPFHFKRTPLTAAQKHAVFLRDQGRCTHVDSAGRRCNQDRWVEIHHLTPVSQGGSNEPENLTTLCGFHHDLVHQLTLPLDYQVTWLRSPRCTYG